VAPSTVRNQQGRTKAIAGRTGATSSQSVTQNTKAFNSRTRAVTSRFDYRSLNRSNAYGGRWVAGDTHRDWDRNRSHYWNNHHYRWWDGGWLIVDGGFWPGDYYDSYSEPYRYSYRDSGSYSDYYSSYATVSAVQRKLADLGYYNDSVDGIIGPNTRSAIAQYQRDFNLAVTGRINDSLLASLGIG